MISQYQLPDYRPAFGVDGGTRRWEAIDCAAFAADHEIFSHWLLPSALTSLLLDAFNDDWRVRHTYKSSGEAPGRIRFEARHIEAGRANEVVRLPIQMATSRHMAPNGCESVLPALDPWLR